jgi:Ca2+ transporting ATPase
VNLALNDFKDEPDKIIGNAINIVIFAVTILVMAVPEGLPLAVTLSLAYSVSKMKDENNLVRHLDCISIVILMGIACETMGGSNNICSDKTGTLTKNRMTVMGLFAEGRVVENSENASDALLSPFSMRLICEGICVNSEAYVIQDEKTKITKKMGNATELALLTMAEARGYNYKDLRKRENEILVISFSSKRKRMTSVYKTDRPENYIVYCKGAPDLLLPCCNKIVAEGGKLIPLDEQQKRVIAERLHRNAEKGYRTIILTSKEIESKNCNPNDFGNEAKYAELESELTILALVGIEDPLRDGVSRAVKICQRAGITVRMVTGDDIDYAKSIAIQCGIASKEELDPSSDQFKQYACMKGVEFAKAVGGLIKVDDPENPGKQKEVIKDPETFRMITSELRVLARSQPEHKYLLVSGLKEDDRNVVAVTGDGTNDAPALKKADIGFAMGIAGTEIAKEASKIILLDDNFGSIVTALKWGRNIYHSIRKFLTFQLTINITALTISVLSALVGKIDPPINAIQMLWVNLIMDTFAALALATEPPSTKVLRELPYGKNESIMNRGMWRNIICGAVYQIAVLLVLDFLRPSIFLEYGHEVDGQSFYDCLYDPFRNNVPPEWSGCEKTVNTMIFHTFVLMQVFNEFNCRRIKSNEFQDLSIYCLFHCGCAVHPSLLCQHWN